VLEDMEEIEELLGIAEIQKVEDEKDLADLRHTLDQLQRARDSAAPRPERHRPRAAPAAKPPPSATEAGPSPGRRRESE
jgi:hypothetical protein